MRPAVVGACMEEILDQPQLPVATDARRLESLRLERAPRAGHDPERAIERVEASFPLKLVGARALVGDRLLGRAASRVADIDGAGLGDGLDARGGVAEGAGDPP